MLRLRERLLRFRVMEWYVRAFLKASLAWLSLGVTLGIAMAVHPAWGIYRTAHMHMNLLGFVTMMIFGVAYHVLPRFTGHALWSPQLPGWHWWGSNVGLTLMVIGFVCRVSNGTAGQVGAALLSTGGTLAALGAYAFAYNMWRTIDGPAAQRAVTSSPVVRATLPLHGR